MSASDIAWDEVGNRIGSITLPGVDHFMVTSFPEHIYVPVAMCIDGTAEDMEVAFEVHAKVLSPSGHPIEEAGVRVDPGETPGRLVDDGMRPAKTFAFGMGFDPPTRGIYTLRWEVQPGGAVAGVVVRVGLVGDGPGILEGIPKA